MNFLTALTTTFYHLAKYDLDKNEPQGATRRYRRKLLNANFIRVAGSEPATVRTTVLESRYVKLVINFVIRSRPIIAPTRVYINTRSCSPTMRIRIEQKFLHTMGRFSYG